MREPSRMIDNDALPHDLRQAISGAQRETPSKIDRDRVLRALLPVVGSTTLLASSLASKAAATVGKSSMLAALTGAFKSAPAVIMAATAAIGVGGTILVKQTSRRDEMNQAKQSAPASSSKLRAKTKTAPATVPAFQTLKDGGAQPEVEDTAEVALTKIETEPRTPKHQKHKAPHLESLETLEPKAAPDIQSSSVESLGEYELLNLAQRTLPQDPSWALSLTETHKKRFPEGQLAEEREAIAIEALTRLGRNQETDKRIEALRKAFPKSIYLHRFEATHRGGSLQ